MIAAGVMSTPPRTRPSIPGDSNTQQHSTHSVLVIYLSAGCWDFGVYPLGLIISWKSAESLEEKQRMNLTPSSTFWDQGDIGKKSPTMCGKFFATHWLPSCSYIPNIPSKNETVYSRDSSSKYIFCIMHNLHTLLFKVSYSSL